MTSRDHKSIQNLYHIHRFTPASIARLYGLSHQRVLQLLDRNTFTVSDTNCLLCGLEDGDLFFIDNDENNHHPQNVLMLCEADKRRMIHLQLRRRVKSRS